MVRWPFRSCTGCASRFVLPSTAGAFMPPPWQPSIFLMRPLRALSACDDRFPLSGRIGLGRARSLRFRQLASIPGFRCTFVVMSMVCGWQLWSPARAVARVSSKCTIYIVLCCLLPVLIRQRFPLFRAVSPPRD
eukprot:scaffold677522_cov42-Prasinocladus_malaysianus.AAC.1